MRAKAVIVGFVLFLVVFGTALWWFQTRAYYETVEGREAIGILGSDLPVVDFQGIDSPTSPLKLRACFRIRDGVAPDAVQHVAEAEGATPLVAPGWFDCFDAEKIAGGIEEGSIRAVMAARDEPWGFDRIVAVDPVGRGWMWRQMNACGRAKFEGDPLPEGCAPAPEE